MENFSRLHDDAQKLRIIEEYVRSGEPMSAIQEKYGLGHCTLSRWMTNYGISNSTQRKYIEMKKRLAKCPEKTQREKDLEARVAQLEKELKVERLKTEAANAIIDVAEENLGIDLRKKTGAKQ